LNDYKIHRRGITVTHTPLKALASQSFCNTDRYSQGSGIHPTIDPTRRAPHDRCSVEPDKGIIFLKKQPGSFDQESMLVLSMSVLIGAITFSEQTQDELRRGNRQPDKELLPGPC
jgi:hypothetical protein